MKHLIITLILTMLVTAGCADNMYHDGKCIETYGLFNEHSTREDNNKVATNIEYELAWGNIIWSIILSETIFAPVYFIGFSLMEPVSAEWIEEKDNI